MIRTKNALRLLAPAAFTVVMLASALPTYAASPTDTKPSDVAAVAKSGSYVGSVTMTEAQAEAAGLVKPIAVTGPRVALTVKPQTICVWDCVVARNKAYWYEGQEYKTQVQSFNHTSTTGTLVLDTTVTATNQVSATFAIPISQVNATMGFNSTESVSIHYGSTWAVPAYTCMKALAYELYAYYTFTIWVEQILGDVQMGSGWARNRDGYRFDLYYC